MQKVALRITGISDSGYMTAVDSRGEGFELHPDGNRCFASLHMLCMKPSCNLALAKTYLCFTSRFPSTKVAPFQWFRPPMQDSRLAEVRFVAAWTFLLGSCATKSESGLFWPRCLQMHLGDSNEFLQLCFCTLPQLHNRRWRNATARLLRQSPLFLDLCFVPLRQTHCLDLQCQNIPEMYRTLVSAASKIM